MNLATFLSIVKFFLSCIPLYFLDWWEFLTKEPKDVQNKVVVITGAAQGIGKEIARILGVQKGARLALIDINQAECESTAEELRASGCRVVEAFRADVTQSYQMNTVAEQIREHKLFGDVDILICNAGVLHLDYIRSQKEADIRKSVEVNYLGYVWTIRAFLGRMEELNSGHIVAVCSVAAFFGESMSHAYSSSKHALRGLMESLEWELLDAKKDGVKLTTAYPYFTDTMMLSGRTISSAFWSILSVRACARGIVRGILLEHVEAFVPRIMNFYCYVAKALPTQRVKIAARQFLDLRFGNRGDQ